MSTHERAESGSQYYYDALKHVEKWGHRGVNEDLEWGTGYDDLSIANALVRHWHEEHKEEHIRRVEIDHMVAFMHDELSLEWVAQPLKFTGLVLRDKRPSKVRK